MVSVVTVGWLRDRGAADIVWRSQAIRAMSTLTVKTNNVPRDLLSTFELSSAQYSKLREQFDWMDLDEFDSAMFFEYRGQVLALSDFMRTEGDLLAQGWQGILNETFFSGIVVKIVESCERIVVGRYCA